MQHNWKNLIYIAKIREIALTLYFLCNPGIFTTGLIIYGYRLDADIEYS